MEQRMKSNWMRLSSLLCLFATSNVWAEAVSFSGYAMQTVGVAQVLDNGDLQLTPDVTGQVGGAWLNTPWSSSDSFQVSFEFSLRNAGPGAMADGFAFVLQNQGLSALGAAGRDVGFTGLNAVGSVVQTWHNNAVGLNISGQAFPTQGAPTSLGWAQQVWGSQTVSYDAAQQRLQMSGFLDVDGVVYAVSDSAYIDLAGKFGAVIYAGFTGATGGASADQRITQFTVLSAVPEPEAYALWALGLVVLAPALRRRLKP
jgi:Bacterial lectin